MSSNPDRRGVGELEGQILGALWSADAPTTAAEVLEQLGGDMAYTTVAKVLDRLCAKGQVSRLRSGRSYRYAPVGAESNWVAGQVKRLLGRAGSRTAVLQGFLDGLDPDETTILAALLEQAETQRASTPPAGVRP